MEKIYKTDAARYTWGDSCLGWNLYESTAAGIKEEMVPPGKSETMHYHTHARQYFHILKGSALMRFAGHAVAMEAGEGIIIPEATAHQFCNESNESVTFLVFSFPKDKWDRVETD
jgi:mannose-6-phosphate isomerase-like protein (cupin superfamily)